jgi:recombination protein RecA
MSEKKLEDLLNQLDKSFGKGSLVRLGDKPKYEYDVISSGSIMLDAALGIGGYPKGRIVEIYGPESSGKTTLTIHLMAEAQKKGGIVGFIDAEHSFDSNYAKAVGVNIDDLYLNQPDNGEQGLEILDQMVKSGLFAAIIVDSVAALVPKKELEGEMGDATMGVHARLMSQAMRKLTGSISKSNTLVVFINQTRSKIGVMFGNPETTTGGNALKFYASQRLDIRRIGSDKTDGEVTANRVKVKVIKNKVAPPFKEAEFNIEFGLGIDKYEEILSIAVDNNIIKKAGSWFSYGESKLGQGKEGVKTLLMDNPELFEELNAKVRALYVPTIEKEVPAA